MNNPNPDVLDDVSYLSTPEVKPELYSYQAIYGFTFFFSTIFGGILLSMNLKRMGKEKDIPTVMAISIGYLVVSAVILNLIPSNRGLSFLTNLGGSYLLSRYVWNKYIGKDIVYSKRKIWIPLFIGLVILALIIAVTIFVLTPH